jgi:ssDNA-binding Zn-finger/Zn-ribbon topoisomerase 1
MAVAKKCEQCGNVDAKVTWSSADDAAKDPMYLKWTCPNCAWTEWELVEAQKEAQPTAR